MHSLIENQYWIIIDDHNIITLLEEKKGDLRWLDVDSVSYTHLTSTLSLVDIESKNDIFMWNNHQGGTNQISSRLVIFLVSKALMMGRLETRS